YYNNDPANGPIYGKLYNWFAMNDPRGLAPAGYHIPSASEWDIYASQLGSGPNFIGGKMKATTLWVSPNTGATNESGFTGLPGGIRNADGTFTGITTYGQWASTEISGATIYGRSLSAFGIVLTKNFGTKQVGVSVRCIKD
ncbi:MAG TPA: fibrobacter succinogenes major paralogous domain-containing protein, partial [Niastella sp.]|nr:fibrobacter succinogenes major paralogous domain-containing protein [Niastella sp.]